MAYGINLFDINENWISLSLQRTVRVNFQDKKATLSLNTQEILVLSSSDGYCYIIGHSGNTITLGSDGSYAICMIFSNNNVDRGGYGVKVYNGSGRVVFSSDQRFLKPVLNLDTSLNKGNFTYNIPSGKRYGVILSNFGFGLHIKNSEVYRDERAAKVANNQIAFSTLKNVIERFSEGKLRFDASFVDNGMYFSATIVDITGY